MSMDAWKQFEQNTVTHSVAHHLVAIAELVEEHGYARVSDVARLLDITRGSASITLKSLKKRGLVVEDERRFLKLSAEGDTIAQSVRAKKRVMKQLLTDLLDVANEQADIDTCKIEHLLSDETATGVIRLLKFMESDHPAVEPFLRAFKGADDSSREELLEYAKPEDDEPA
jgi:Mn-dependent DtxR family transcriptional regulator